MSVHQFTVRTADGDDLALSKFAGKILIVVNTASNCSFANSNMLSLANLSEFPDVVVLCFPCQQFGRQEPKRGCALADWSSFYHPRIVMCDFVDVRGEQTHPLFSLLQQIVGRIRWNFVKVVCNRDGIPIARVEPPCDAGPIVATLR